MNRPRNSQKPMCFALLLCTILFGGLSCTSDQDERIPTSAEYDTIARGIAPLVSIELSSSGVLETSTHLAFGDDPFWLELDSNGTLAGVIGGVTWDVLLECWSAGSSDPDGCSEYTNDAELSVALAGALNLPSYHAELDVDSNWALGGLQTDLITASGEASISAESDYDSFLFEVAHYFHFDLDLEYDFRIPLDDFHATSGSAEATVEASFAGTDFHGNSSEGDFVVHARIELDGAGNATLTLDGSVRYDLDLEAGIVIRIED